MKFLNLWLILMLNLSSLEANMAHLLTPITDEWKQENLVPFNELMLTWNGSRPIKGKYLFYASVKTHDWSPWLLYASWGSYGQTSYNTILKDFSVKVYQDAIEVTGDKKATGFRVKVIAEDGADLSQIFSLHVYTNGNKTNKASSLSDLPIYLDVPQISQMTLKHSRHQDLCSPTSLTAVMRYLANKPNIDPIDTAEKVWDAGFDIYGNWVFNVAHAAACLGPEWKCWVERLDGFGEIHNYLNEGMPVIVSVRGPLSGSALSYSKGHLLVVIGFDPSSQKVICMDPAFPKDEKTHVFYALQDFLEAWGRRGNVAYVFTRHPIGE